MEEQNEEEVSDCVPQYFQFLLYYYHKTLFD